MKPSSKPLRTIFFTSLLPWREVHQAHIFVAIFPYCLHVTLRARLRALAPGLTPRAVLDKFATIQMLDVHFPTTDRRTLILSRYTQPEADQKILLEQLRLQLPAQPPPRIPLKALSFIDSAAPNVVKTFKHDLHLRPSAVRYIFDCEVRLAAAIHFTQQPAQGCGVAGGKRAQFLSQAAFAQGADLIGGDLARSLNRRSRCI